MMMNSFVPRKIQQPVKPALLVVLNTLNQKHEEKIVEKTSSITTSFGGYKHFELKRNGERLFGNDLMGKTKPVPRMETDKKKETSKDTPSKEQKEKPKETNERRGHEDNQDDNFGRGIYRLSGPYC